MSTYITKITPVEGSKGTSQLWELRYYGRVVARGVEETKEKANAKMAEAIFTATQTTNAKKKKKGAARTALQSLLERRPYAAMGVTELLLNNLKRADVLKEALVAEETWWKRHPVEERERIPSKDNGTARRGPVQMPAHEAANRFMDYFVTLEMVVEGEGGAMKPTKRLESWAANVFGEDWLKRKTFGTRALLVEAVGEKKAAELMKSHGRAA